MKRRVLTCILGSVVYFTNAQVGIETDSPHATAILDMSQVQNKGVLMPQISLDNERDRATIGTPKKGLILYNKNDNNSISKGYHYYNNEKWEPIHNTSEIFTQGISQNIHASTLGYVPFGFSDFSLEELSYYGATSIKRECFSFQDIYVGAEPHTYCGYTMDGAVTWEQAFEFAKYQKGYIVTITSDLEWQAIKSHLLTQGGNANNNIWIGYNTVETPGNTRKYTWITGEKSFIDWSNTSGLQTVYGENQPDGTEGCVYISDSQFSTDRKWYNDNCDSTQMNGKPFNYIIIEFHN